MIKKILLVGLLMIWLLFNPNGFIFAQTAPAEPTLAAIKKGAEQIDDNNSIALRRKLLGQIIDFTKIEVLDLKKKVNESAVGLEGVPASLQNQFISKLNNFSYQLSNLTDVLNSVKNINELKALATSLRGWRDFYLAETKKMREWLLYNQIIDLHQKAQIRLLAVQKDILSVNNKIDNYAEILITLNKASTSLTLAGSAMASANESILNLYLDLDYRFSAREYELPSKLLGQSLLHLKDTYLAFLGLGLLLDGRK